MRRVKGTNTGPEIALRRALWRAGIRAYRLNYPLPGKPDLVFPSKKLAVFVDGCFWHGCPRCYRQPENNKEYWVKKVARNMERDQRVNRELRRQGWTVIRLWEHEVRDDLEGCVARIEHALEHEQLG